MGNNTTELSWMPRETDSEGKLKLPTHLVVISEMNLNSLPKNQFHSAELSFRYPLLSAPLTLQPFMSPPIGAALCPVSAPQRSEAEGSFG